MHVIHKHVSFRLNIAHTIAAAIKKINYQHNLNSNSMEDLEESKNYACGCIMQYFTQNSERNLKTKYDNFILFFWARTEFSSKIPVRYSRCQIVWLF